MATKNQTLVSQLYVAILGRAPEQAGLAYWSNALDFGRHIYEMAGEVYASYVEHVPSVQLMTNEEIVRTFYKNALGRDRAQQDDEGIAYWTGRLNEMKASSTSIPEFFKKAGTVLYDIVYATMNYHGDNPVVLQAQALMNNKAAAGLAFAMAGGTDTANHVLDGVTVAMTAEQAAALGAAAAHPVYALSADAPSIAEGDAGTKILTFKLTLDKAPSEAVSVAYETLATGTASANQDFVPVNGTVTFAAGQTVATVSVTVDGDTAVEGHETVKLRLTGASLTAAVTATGTIANDDVSAAGVQHAVAEDAATLNGSLVASVQGMDGALTFTQVGGVAGFTLNPNGTYSFDPTNAAYQHLKAGEVAVVAATYQATNGTQTAGNTVTFTVTGTNDVPVARAQTVGGIEDTVVTGQVSASDADGDALTYTVIGSATNGTVVMNPNTGEFVFTPAANVSGDSRASFNYAVTDGTASSSSRTVTINLAGTNDAPVAQAAAGGAVVEDRPQISGNLVVSGAASDVDGNASLSFSTLQGAAGFTLAANGAWTFDPAAAAYQHLKAGEVANVVAAYQVSDGALTAQNTVTFTVTGTNDLPVATSMAVGTYENVAVIGQVAATDVDGDTLTFTASNARNGTVAMDATTGQYTFTPAPDYFGVASFDYVANDGTGNSVARTVTIDVADVVNVLTSGLDVITLTNPGAEAVLGANDALGAGDSVSGGAEDTVHLSLDGNLAGSGDFAAFRLQNIGTFKVTNDSGDKATFDMSSSNVVRTLVSENSTDDVRFNYANTNPDGQGHDVINLDVLNLTDGVNVTLDVRSDDAAGSNDVLNLRVTDSDDDSVDAGEIAITAAGTGAVDHTTPAGIETVNLSTAGSTGEVRILDLDTPGATLLNISTAEDLVIGDDDGMLGDIEHSLSASVRTVNAAGSTGGIALSTENSSGGATVTGGSGNDVFETSDYGDSVDGGAGNDVLRVGGGANSVQGGAGNDTVTAGSGADLVFGGEGNDDINADGGNNTVHGDAGDDHITVGSGNDVVTGDAGNDRIDIGLPMMLPLLAQAEDGDPEAQAEAEAEAQANLLELGLGNGSDSVSGGTGDDVVNAGASLTSSFTEAVGDNDNGGDTLDGGAGNDTLNLYSFTPDGNILDRVTGFENIVIQEPANWLLHDELTINVTDTSAFDQDSGTSTTIDASDMSHKFTFNGNDLSPLDGIGDDVLSRSITVLGGSAGDSITTGLGGDSIRGNAGNDTISSGAGNDTVDGSVGNDSVSMDGGNDLLIVQSGQLDGNDALIDGGDGTDKIQLVHAAGSGGVTTAVLGNEIRGIQELEIVDNTGTSNSVQITVAGAAGNYDNLEPGGAVDQSTLAINGAALDANESLVVNTTALDGDSDGIDEDFAITGGAGNDRFVMGNNLDSGDTVQGGAGNDTIAATGNDGGDVRFTNVSSVEAYEFAGAHAATLAGNAQAAGIVTVEGSNGNDGLDASAFTRGLWVSGNGGNDTLATGSGNDSVNAGAGNDTVSTGAGNDIVSNEHAGTERIDLGEGDDTLIVDFTDVFDQSDTVIGGSGNDTVRLDNAGGAVTANVNLTNVTGVETYYAVDSDRVGNVPYNFRANFSGGNVTTLNTITVDARGVTDNDGDSLTVDLSALGDKDYQFNVYGGVNGDTVIGSGLPENLVFDGGAGNDRLEIDGADLGTTVTTDGGAGRDTIAISSGQVTDDSFVGVASYEVLTVTAGQTLVQAQLGAKAMAAGIDSIIGGAGADRITIDAAFNPAGGLTVNLSNDGANDVVDASASSVAVTFQADASDISATDDLKGGLSAGDRFELRADGGTADLSGVRSVGSFVVVESGDANIGMTITDATFGTLPSNSIDVITVDGRALDDLGAQLPEGGMTLDAGGVTSSRAFVVWGGTGADSITTGSGNDTIDVGEGNDTVNSGAGNDVITNAGGNNVVNAGDGNDSVTLADGDNRVDAGNGNDTVSVGNGNNTVVGGAGDDSIQAGSGGNWITGGDGNDTIRVGGVAGSAGSTITGGAGQDAITLGAGADRLRIENVSDSEALTRDVVTGFTSGSDRVVIETQMVDDLVKASFAAAPVPVAQAYTSGSQVGVNFSGNAADFSDAQGAIALTGGNGHADYVFEQDNHKLWIDVNDDGVLNGADVQITLAGVSALASGDVVLRDTIAPTFAAAAGSVTESLHAGTTTDAGLSGNLGAIDTDGGAVTYTDVVGGTLAGNNWSKAGTYGTLALDRTTGAFTYAKNGAAIEALDTGEVRTDVFTITATDDAGNTTVNTYTVTVTGANDAPVLAAVAAGSVTETLHSTTQTIANLSGMLVATDVDVETIGYGVSGYDSRSWNGTHWVQSKTSAYGTLTVNETTGAYSFAKTDAAIEALDTGESPSATFAMTVTDGTITVTQNYVITFNGADDQPTLAPVAAGSVSEVPLSSLTLSAGLSGTLTSADVDVETPTYGIDTGTVVDGVVTKVGTYGTLVVHPVTGAYSYAPNAQIEALAQGQSVTDSFTVTVSDGDHPVVSQTYTVNLTGGNDAPVITVGAGDAIAAAPVESNTLNLTVSDTLTVTDVDFANSVTAQVVSVVASGYTTGAPANLALLGMMSVTAGAIAANAGDSSNLAWTFNSDGQSFGYLDAAENLVLTYTIRVTDTNGATADQAVTITVTGANQAPDIRVEVGDLAAVTLTEGNAPLSANDTLTVTDVDASDTVSSTVSVLASGVTTGLGSSNAQLAAMMTVVPPTGLAANTGNVNNLTWAFNSSSNGERFDYLDENESLMLTYTVTATDVDGGLADTQNVVVTVSGTNDGPVFDASGAGDGAAATLAETNGVLTATDTLSVFDADRSDAVTLSHLSVATTGDRDSFTDGQLQGMLTWALSDGGNADSASASNVTWTFNSGAANAFDYLDAGDTLQIVYTLNATDDSSATDGQTVTVTITGTNDAPTLSLASTTASSVTLTATDGDASAVLSLVDDINGVENLNKGSGTTFGVQQQASVVVTDLVVTDGTADVDSGLTLTQGTAGADTLNAVLDRGVYYGFGGNDAITGGANADIVYGGDGSDTIDGDADNDTIDGGNGNDIIIGGAGLDAIIGGFGADTITGGQGNDTIDLGNLTADGDLIVFASGEGRDTVTGFDGQGTDQVRFSDFADRDGNVGSLEFQSAAIGTNTAVAVAGTELLVVTGATINAGSEQADIASAIGSAFDLTGLNDGRVIFAVSNVGGGTAYVGYYTDTNPDDATVAGEIELVGVVSVQGGGALDGDNFWLPTI